MLEQHKCPICGQDNPDVIDDHLVAFADDYGYSYPSVVVHLCINCHRAIHRCSWALISQDSEAIVAKYLSYLEATLPTSLFQTLREELLVAKENTERQCKRMSDYELAPSPDKKCSLCECANPDFLEEHNPSAWSQSITEVIIDICANCHRVLVKFYDKKVLPTSDQSKALLRKYLSQVGELLSTQAKNELIKFIGSD